MNTIGERYRFTSFGESHGPAIGGVIDGCPAGVRLDMAAIERDLLRRRLGVAELRNQGTTEGPGVSARAAAEPDEIEWLSGLLDGVTLGTPIAFIIRNRAARPEDYEALKEIFRPGHADFTYQAKYGIRDWRGGGRASARETASRVVAGTVAKQLLAEHGITVKAELTQVGTKDIRTHGLTEMRKEIERAQAEGDSVGGIVSCVISGVPAGWGEPVFDKVQARLAYAMLSINACKGFEYGVGFASAEHRGSEINHLTGGIAGGITDGSDITFRVVFKPTPSITKPQQVNGQTVHLKGRFDACVAVRAVPVVEAMAAMVICDYMVLTSRARTIGRAVQG